MKLVVFLAILAFAAAGPVQNPIIISAPNKLIVISQSEDYKKNDFQGTNSYRPYKQQYWPQNNSFQVAQYITYVFNQAQENGYQATEISTQLTKQEFPEFVVKYFSEQFDNLRNQPFEKSLFEIFQYYYEQGFPKEVQQFIAQQIAQAYQQYRSKIGPQSFEESQENPLSVGQYVTRQINYYLNNGVSYPVFQYSIQQLQKVQQYIESTLEENGNISQYQYLTQQLKQSAQNIRNAYKAYQAYESYEQYYVPYYAAEYFYQQVKEAYQYLQNAYQYIQQSQVQYRQPQSIFQLVNPAYLITQNIYQLYQQSQFGESQLESNNKYSFSYVEYVTRYLQLAQQNAQKAQEFFLQKDIQNNAPQSVVTYIVEQLKLGKNYAQKAYETLQGAYETQDSQSAIIQQLQQALSYLENAYQATQQYSFGVEGLREAEYALQYIQNAYFAQINYQRLYPGYASNKPTYSQGFNLSYYQTIQQIQLHIQNAQQFIQSQSNLPQASLLSQQLAKSYQLFQPAGYLFQQSYLPQPIVRYAKQQAQQAREYLFIAYHTAQQYELYYVIQQLQFALKLAQNLQFPGLYQDAQGKAIIGNQYNSYYGYENTNQNIYQQPNQYSLNIQQYLQQLAAQDIIPQQYARYIIQQLQEAQEYNSLRYKFGSQYYNGIENFNQEKQQYYQNIYQYVQQQVAKGYISEYSAEYLLGLVKAAQQGVQKPYLPYQQRQYSGQKYSTYQQGYDQSFLKNYFHKKFEYPITNDYQDEFVPYGQDSYLTYQQEPSSNEYYTTYSPFASQYSPYGYQGLSKDDSLYKTFNKGSYPYGYKSNADGNTPIASSAA